MTNKELQKLGEALAWEYWKVNVYIPIVISNRLKVKSSKFVYTKPGLFNAKAIEIRISNKILNEPTLVRKVLTQELLHYVLCVRGEAFEDGCKEFESEMERLGIDK